jgi:predicted RNA-binding protein YlxR (DUF448 family)
MLATAQDTELDRGTTSVGPGMERHCALTRELKPVAELVRFVVGPDGAVVPDVKRKLPGRGLWVTGTRAAIAEAVKRNVFARGFKRQVAAPASLPAETERLLERAALDALAIARKAGTVVPGFAKVEAALRTDAVAALIHASDAAPEGVRKLNAALRRKTPEKSREIAIIQLFTGEQLDLALNRPNVVHAALLDGPTSVAFIARAKRLQSFRNVPANAPADGARGQTTE